MSSNMCLSWRCTYACSPEILNGISAVLPQSLRSLYTACSLCAWSKPGDRSSFNCSVVKGRLPREALPIVSQPLYPHTQTSTCAHVFGTMTKPFDMYCSLTPCSSRQAQRCLVSSSADRDLSRAITVGFKFAPPIPFGLCNEHETHGKTCVEVVYKPEYVLRLPDSNLNPQRIPVRRKIITGDLASRLLALSK